MIRYQRLFVIVHLCFTFTYLIQALLTPCVTRYFERKAEQQMFYVLLNQKQPHQEKSDVVIAPSFQNYQHIRNCYHEWQQRKEPPFIEQVWEALNYTIQGTSAYSRAWLAFSLAICLLWLFKVEGAGPASWVLPLIIGIYAITGRPACFFATHLPPVLIESLKKDANTCNLTSAWHRYLITHYLKQEPHSDPQIFQQQGNQALYLFELHHFQKWEQKMKKDRLGGYSSWPSKGSFFVYFLWNLGFAIAMSHNPYHEKQWIPFPKGNSEAKL